MATLKSSDIKPNPNNPRIIKDDKFKKLVQSLKDFPEMAEVREVIVNKDHIILGGNMRYKAMIEAGWKDIPVRVVDWSEDKQKEFIIKDNISGGEWDWDILANEWDSLILDNWGLDLPTNFGVNIEEDEAPEVDEQNPPVSKLGEIYQLGNHRLMCGDSTSEENVNLLLGNQRIDLYLTDPPYNVDYTGKTKDALKIDNDRKDDIEFLAFLTDANLRADEHMKEGASFYIFHADSEGYNFRASVKSVSWMLKQCLVWVKQSMVMGRQDYQWQHEPILYGWKAGASHNWFNDRRQTTILQFDRPSRSEAHPTMKPLSILSYLIGNSTKAGDLVFDSFLGSGSTLIACESTNRVCYGIEIDPKYCDVIRKRYHMMATGATEGWEVSTPVISERAA